MKRFLAAHAAAVAVVLFAGAGANAGMIPPDKIQWTYNFAPGMNPAAVFADNHGGVGSVTFTNENPSTAKGNSDIVATNLKVSSTATAVDPDVLSHNGTYTIKLHLGVPANGLSGDLTFTGKLSGTFSADNANVTNVFGPNSTQTLTLGNYTFTVQLTAYTPPGPPSQHNLGSISAHVTVEASDIGPGGGPSPEPSSMLLAGLGLSFLGGAAWRKRRKANASI
jgi:hypothetical protein